jgi:hypothetical protein
LHITASNNDENESDGSLEDEDGSKVVEHLED